MQSSIISHVSLGTNNYPNAKAFYEKILSALGFKIIEAHDSANYCAFGIEFPEFFIGTPINGDGASVGNGTHVSFLAPNKDAVDTFYTTALSAGATDDGAPGPREAYGAGYYGCFVRDLDGHKIEAMHWDEEV